MRTRKVRKLLTEKEKEERHGVPASCRLPAQVKLRIMQKADRLGMSFGQCFAAEVVSLYESQEHMEEEIERQCRLLRESYQLEMNALKKALAETEQQSIKCRPEDKPEIESLQRSRACLEQLSKRKSVITIDDMNRIGFNFSHSVTSLIEMGSEKFRKLFNMAYRVEGQVVTIINLDPAKS